MYNDTNEIRKKLRESTSQENDMMESEGTKDVGQCRGFGHRVLQNSDDKVSGICDTRKPEGTKKLQKK